MPLSCYGNTLAWQLVSMNQVELWTRKLWDVTLGL